ncbi:MAG: hypothetical protein R3E79_62045 [Caldilineaceae bacterium]
MNHVEVALNPPEASRNSHSEGAVWRLLGLQVCVPQAAGDHRAVDVLRTAYQTLQEIADRGWKMCLLRQAFLAR